MSKALGPVVLKGDLLNHYQCLNLASKDKNIWEFNDILITMQLVKTWFWDFIQLGQAMQH